MPSPETPPVRPLRSLALFVLAGLVGGMLEVLVQWGRVHLLHRSLPFGRDYVWVIPLIEAIMGGIGGAIVGLVGLVIKPLQRRAVVVAIAAAWVVAPVLWLYQPIHPAASAVLALGIGSAVSRLLGPRASGLERTAVWLVPAGLAATIGAGFGLHAWLGWTERRALAALPAVHGKPPNVVLIILDTVRAWNLSWYGYGRPTTPRLAARVAEGVRFDRVIAPAPWTTPSHATLFTGRYPTELSANWLTPLDGTFPTLAEALRDAGYLTAGFVANYVFTGHGTGLDRGFAHYVDDPVRPIPLLRYTSATAWLKQRPWLIERLGPRRFVTGRDAAEVNEATLGWLGQAGRGDRPFFLFLNYFDAHAPYAAPPPYDSLFMPAKTGLPSLRYFDMVERSYGRGPFPRSELEDSYNAYDGALAYLDRAVDSLLGELGRRGLLSNTIVVIASDHGEQFGEHRVVQHGNSLYLPALHVPLAILWPGRVPARRVSYPTSLRDVAATILGLAGVKNPGLPGRSLARYWEGGDTTSVDTLLSAVDYSRLLPKNPPSPVLSGSLRSVILDSLQYIRNGDGSEELYQLGKDFWQVRNLAARPEFAGELEKLRGALLAVTGQRARD
ncbi:MAG: sulfatase [Gemmatimonadota bacterium]